MKTHFAIVADQGSGHEALTEILGRHPAVRMYGELFCRNDYDIIGKLSAQGVLVKLGEDPIDCLETKIFTDHDPEIQAIGFVLLYGHARSDSWSKVWSYVRKKLQVVHFKRRNLLDLHLCKRPGRRFISPTEVEHIVRRGRDAQRDNDIYFRHSEKIDVFYESLLEVELEDSFDAMQEVCDFLKLPPNFTGDLLALTPPDQADRIVNHEELKQHFNDKPEGEFFR